MDVVTLEQWFKAADEDRDGVIKGAEAVRFFQRSGLAQDVLGQIWDFASSGAASLTKVQFGTAMRLVALAQGSGGRLLPDQARMIVIGTGPQLPAPKLQGLNVTEKPTFAAPPAAAGYAPQMTGQGYAPQMTGQYMPQMTGQYTPQMTGQYTPQMTGMIPTYAPQMTGMPASGYMAHTVPGQQGYAPHVTGAAPGGFPPASAADMQRYGAAFVQLDSDRDGYVQGSECFGYFLQSGLEKVVLRDVWSVVAGNQGKLSQEQFTKCLYLMDCAKKGIKLPQALPQGQFPPLGPGVAPAPAPPAAAPAATPSPTPPATAAPAAAAAAAPAVPQAAALAAAVLPAASARVASPAPAAAAPAMPGMPPAATSPVPGMMPAAPGMMPAGMPGTAPGAPGLPVPDIMSAAQAPGPQHWTLATQFGNQGMQASMDAAYNIDVKIPTLPPKADFSADQVAKPVFQSKMPGMDPSRASLLKPEDAARLERERAVVAEKEAALYGAQNEVALEKQRAEVFREALQEVALFKSRMDVALLQAQEQAGRLQNEAEQLQKRYQQAYLGAEDTHAKARSTREHIQKLLAQKTEAALKLSALEQELQMIAAMDPQQTTALEKEVQELAEAVAEAEAEKAGHEMHIESVRKQKELLTRRVADHKAAAAAAQSELAACARDVAELEKKAAPAKAGSEEDVELGALLVKAAGCYRALHSLAGAKGLEVPHDAQLALITQLDWNDAVMAGTADWMDTDEEAAKGFVLANAFPDLEAMPPSIIAALNNASETTEPKPVLGVAPVVAPAYAPTPAKEVAAPAAAPAAAAAAAPAADKAPSAPVSPKAAAAAVTGAAAAAAAEAASPRGPPPSKELRFSDADEVFSTSSSVETPAAGATAPPALAAFVQQQAKGKLSPPPEVDEEDSPPPKRKVYERAAAGWDAYFDDNAFVASKTAAGGSPPPPTFMAPPPAPAAAAAPAASASSSKATASFGFDEDAFGGGAFGASSEASTPATADASKAAAAGKFNDFSFGDSAF